MIYIALVVVGGLVFAGWLSWRDRGGSSSGNGFLTTWLALDVIEDVMRDQ